MAGSLDKALLQMAGFEPEGDLYAKAADKWSGIETQDYPGKTGYDFQIEKDINNDAANWGFKDADARLNALLYAWSKDNPDEKITPELISKLRYLAGTADSMNVTGGWLTDRVYEDPHVTGLLELIKKDPVKANNIFKAQGYNSDSPIQNYFDWATQFMNKDTNSTVWRNMFGEQFNKAVRAGSRKLEDELNTAINTPSLEQITKSNLEEDQRKMAEEKAEHERRRKAYINAGLSDIDDPTPRKSTYPTEWLPKKLRK